MPTTQRPFFANFLAAFRAHSAIQQSKASSSPSNTATTSSSSQTTTSGSSPSQPRSITTSTSTKAGPTTTALSTLHSPRTHSASPLSRSPGPNPLPIPSGTSSPGGGFSDQAAAQAAAGRYISRGRRGSDSSSEGFRDVLGAEKWYIGGRTATGEERYFKLGVVRRQRSVDRLSLDRLSL